MTQPFYKNLKVLVLSISIIFSLTHCSRPPAPPIPDNSKPIVGLVGGMAIGAAVSPFTSVTVPAAVVMGGIYSGVVGKLLAGNSTLFSDLDRAHLQLFKIGQNYMFVLPADAYFYADSSHLNEAFYPALDRIAEFLRQCETEVIKVAGFTDNVGNQTRNVALSRQQAQNILDYLWNQGLDARMMYSVGYGEQFPIANNDYLEGRSANRRVQITFQLIPTEDV